MNTNQIILRGRKIIANYLGSINNPAEEVCHNRNIMHRPMVVAKGDILFYRGIIPVAIRHHGKLYLNFEFYDEEFRTFFHRLENRALEFYSPSDIIKASEADMVSLQWFIEGKEKL